MSPQYKTLLKFSCVGWCVTLPYRQCHLDAENAPWDLFGVFSRLQCQGLGFVSTMRSVSAAEPLHVRMCVAFNFCFSFYAFLFSLSPFPTVVVPQIRGHTHMAGSLSSPLPTTVCAFSDFLIAGKLEPFLPSSTCVECRLR